jgi:hypothetical protein
VHNGRAFSAVAGPNCQSGYLAKLLARLAYDCRIGANLRRDRWKYLLIVGFLLGLPAAFVSLLRNRENVVVQAHLLLSAGRVAGALETPSQRLGCVAEVDHGKSLISKPGKNCVFAAARAEKARMALIRVSPRVTARLRGELDPFNIGSTHLRRPADAPQRQADYLE